MAGSLNRVELIGNVGKDPEVRTFQSGGKIATFSIATTERWKDKQTGQPAMAIRPGSAHREICGVIYERGEPSQAWCWVHWLARFGAIQPELFSEVRLD